MTILMCKPLNLINADLIFCCQSSPLIICSLGLKALKFSSLFLWGFFLHPTNVFLHPQTFLCTEITHSSLLGFDSDQGLKAYLRPFRTAGASLIYVSSLHLFRSYCHFPLSKIKMKSFSSSLHIPKPE